MLLKIKEKIKKLRIFKRLRIYQTNIEYIKGLLNDKIKTCRESVMEAVHLYDKMVVECLKVTEKKEKASKHIATQVKTIRELETRRDEFLCRVKSKMPDDVISKSFENYKYWLAESFIVEKYKPYSIGSEQELFIDEDSAKRGFGIVLNKVEELDKAEEIVDDKEVVDDDEKEET